ncbi:hypothetical protein K432DRAFT_355954 [Lepidopterella palustris CBS 459.81]|uniref:Transglutaminase-like domain-containing protein n=1 Tax=Lepidopterella palustris CBS 459.81 TaxID=1314670 RepID=A0A8E2JDU9_9PEZI|nr:hypothetical protein K432DRAFT_355954 [Lepidopterella palustris CBS 459.81]
MADSAPPIGSIKSRIAALNLEEVHKPAPGAPPPYTYDQAVAKKSRPPPPPPPSQPPSIEPRRQTTSNPPLQCKAPSSMRQIGNIPVKANEEAPKQQPSLPPRLPPRTISNPQQAPSLPPRKSSEQSIRRRESAESVSTTASGRSSLSVGSTHTGVSSASYLGDGQVFRMKAPPYDPSKLPPLPPKKAKEEPRPARTALKATHSSPSVVSKTDEKRIQPPPVLPSRPPLPARQSSTLQEPSKPEPPKRSALSFGLNKATETPPPLPPSRPSDASAETTGAPPPIPLSTRPNLAALQSSKPKLSTQSSCLKCRDFSAPDTHAARFPRQSLPSMDLGWLAHQLTSPFPSLTDKARAIFTWLHHNIDYDTKAFFSNNVKSSTPSSTLSTGLAVCEGYAGLFTALAANAGLESVVVGGHGKGYGHAPLKPGQRVPPYAAGHAWNAVRIDNGEWKLIDACWGSGNVKGKNMPYNRDFHPEFFTMDNNEFGASHFPEDKSRFYRTDGRAEISWEEYMMEDMGERVLIYGPATPDHGIGQRTFQPKLKHIKLDDPGATSPNIRFHFAAVCPHWDNEKHGKGKPYLMVLHIEGRDGKSPEYLPFETDGSFGRVWWLDVARTELGRKGGKVSVVAITKFDGKEGRGLSGEEFRRKVGKVGMGWGGVAEWELV